MAVPGGVLYKKKRESGEGEDRSDSDTAISGHYFRCKEFTDFGTENITKTMNAIAAEAAEVEKSE